MMMTDKMKTIPKMKMTPELETTSKMKRTKNIKTTLKIKMKMIKVLWVIFPCTTLSHTVMINVTL